MFYIDTNILLYAQDHESVYHESSKMLLRNCFYEDKAFFSQIVITEFFAIITDSRKILSHWTVEETVEYLYELSRLSEIHAINEEIYREAIETAAVYGITRYDIYDHLIACSMKYHGISRLITANAKDFKKYTFIEEIIEPDIGNNSSRVREHSFIPYGRQLISTDDIQSVAAVLKSDYLTTGPAVTSFEKALCDYTGARYCVAVANATAGLHLAVAALEIEPGKEGVTSPNTFVASANCLVYNGLKPVFADIDAATYNIDPDNILTEITDKTRVLIPVHFAGRPCDMVTINKIAGEHNLAVIEDAAHAIGGAYADGSKVGSCMYSDMTVFSFHPVKTMTTGEGGVITTNDKKLYERLALLRSHGITKDPEQMSRNPGPWYYEMQKLGFNYRMTDIQAALGVSQLKKLERFARRRREIVERYNAAFSDVEWITAPADDDGRACFHLYVVLIDFEKIGRSKKEVIEHLWEKGIGPQVHYIPVHTQPFYREYYGYKWGDYPHAEAYYEKALSLPLYPKMDIADTEYIIKIINEIV